MLASYNKKNRQTKFHKVKQGLVIPKDMFNDAKVDINKYMKIIYMCATGFCIYESIFLTALSRYFLVPLCEHLLCFCKTLISGVFVCTLTTTNQLEWKKKKKFTKLWKPKHLPFVQGFFPFSLLNILHSHKLSSHCNCRVASKLRTKTICS